MADYKLPDYVTKRLRYFNNQFLQEQDFIDEQNYHVDRQRRHNRLLHTPGIADGLDVKITGATQVEVTTGTAIDGKGRQILVPEIRTVEVKDGNSNFFKQGQSVFLVISYSDPERESDITTVGGEGATRWLEEPKFECYDQNSAPDENTFLRLAQFEIGEDGKVNSVNTKVRKIAGGKIGIIEGSIDETKLDETTRKKLVNNGNNHDHKGGNGAQITHSSLTLDGGTNPHGTTVDNVLDVTNNKVSRRVFVQASVPGIYDPPNNSSNIRDKGSVFVLNTSSTNSYGLVAKVAETADVPPLNNKTIPAAAVVAIAGRQNVYGIYTTALTSGFALNVDGKANFAGGLNSGHISDTFINASGQRLTTGDVVKLKGTPVTQFRGSQNKIPIAEVTLADRENDTLVIGIVDSEAIPDPGQPDTRVKPEDPSFIEDGGELYLVTLGVFAHCKVDATDIPIEVGDLLTTSHKPGHAKKATDPKLGSIIGKALDPLEKGTGYISVFVNIQ